MPTQVGHSQPVRSKPSDADVDYFSSMFAAKKPEQKEDSIDLTGHRDFDQYFMDQFAAE